MVVVSFELIFSYFNTACCVCLMNFRVRFRLSITVKVKIARFCVGVTVKIKNLLCRSCFTIDFKRTFIIVSLYCSF